MRKIERKKIVDHINSDYVESWGILSGNPRTVVYVEGWDDIAFWRSVFDDFEHGGPRQFEVMTPSRSDMAKGKKVVLGFADKAGKRLILCVDSDFDYLFDDHTQQSSLINSHPYIVQTYTYSIENLLCLPSSLGSVAAKITKNDTPVFDFEEFFSQYSRTIYPLFLWYIFTARIDTPNMFTLSDFRNAVRINYLMVEDNGDSTIQWLKRNISHRVEMLNKKYPEYLSGLKRFEAKLKTRGVKSCETHMYIQGHTLMDNVVKIVLQTVCNYLRQIALNRIQNSKSAPITKRNETGAYNNALRDIDTVLNDNTLYKNSICYKKIASKIEGIINETEVQGS